MCCIGQTQGAERRTHKPHGIEGGPAEARQVHTSPSMQRAGPRSWGKYTQAPWCAHKPWDIECGPVSQNKGKQMQKPCNTQHKLVGLREAHARLWCSAGWDPETEALAKIPGTGRGLVALKICWEGHFDMAAEIDMSKNAKARRTAQRHTEPIDTPKCTTGHSIAFQRGNLALSTRT